MAANTKVIHVVNSLDIMGGAEKIAIDICKEYGHILLYKKSQINPLYDCNLVRKESYNSTLHLLWRIIKTKNTIFYFHLFPGNWTSLLLPSKSFIIHEHNSWNRRRKYQVLRIFEYSIYKRAFRVICISKAVENSLKEWLIFKSHNLTVIENFIIKPNESERCPFEKNSYILFAGSLTSQKGHLKFIEEWNNSSYKDYYNIVIAGEGPLKKPITTLISKFNLEKNIFLVGNINIGPYLKNCFCAILPSKWEGFGLFAIEAALYKKFTIGTNVPGLNTLIAPECLLDINYTYKSIDLILKKLISNKVDPKFLVKIIKQYDRSVFYKKFNALMEIL